MSAAFEAAGSVALRVAGAVHTAVPSPSPTRSVPDDLEVTPGLVGFLATFALAAACVLLFLSLTRHLRRAGHNARELGLPVEEPKRRGAGRDADDGAQDLPRETPPDSPVDRSDDGRGTPSP